MGSVTLSFKRWQQVSDQQKLNQLCSAKKFPLLGRCQRRCTTWHVSCAAWTFWPLKCSIIGKSELCVRRGNIAGLKKDTRDGGLNVRLRIFELIYIQRKLPDSNNSGLPACACKYPSLMETSFSFFMFPFHFMSVSCKDLEITASCLLG